MRASLE
jgi:DNA-binding transcriptional ArsR family regulator